MTERWLLNKEMFGPLWQFIEDENISDIDWDGDSLWISSVTNGTKKVDIEGLTPEFIDNFTHYVKNNSGQEFNQVKNVLSSETDTLRITFVHESLATSGRCFSIRKSMPKLRFSALDALKDGYCEPEVMHLLANCVSMHSNFAFCGEPGAGKTECAKFFSTFIQDSEKVITVEDTLEWHYKYINPGKRADEIKVNDAEDYTKAIKVALRLNPSWLMLSEARSTEVQFLIEGWSTGVHGMTTLHTGDVRDIPDRVTNMMDKGLDPARITNNIYSYLNIGVLLKKEEDLAGNTSRKIKQVGLFRHTDDGNECTVIVDNGHLYKERIPKWFLDKLAKCGIENPFFSPALQKRFEDERAGQFYGMGDNDINLNQRTFEYEPESTDDDRDIIDIIESSQRG